MGAGGRAIRLVVGPIAGLAMAGCELTEVTLTTIEDVVVAEGLLVVPEVDPGGPSGLAIARVLLHRTLGEDGTSGEVPGARVEVRGVEGSPFVLAPAPLEDCVSLVPESGGGSCYVEDGVFIGSVVRPGERIELTVDLADGGRLESVTRVPSSFDLVTVEAEASCRLSPEENLEVAWRPSEDAWAYVVEAAIYGLRDALAPRGIEVDADPLVLLGLAISASDTTLVFPAEMGLFERADLDQDLALALQEGLPAATEARVTVAAVDRNYVNWARGGNFNPSGPVRVPSVVGDGTGFFGSAVLRSFFVLVDGSMSGGPPPCAGS